MALSSTVEPQVSIILPCRNEADHIDRCLSSILAQHQPEGGFEIIVADGMSDDGTREVLKQMEDERWKREDGGPTPEVGSQSSNLQSPIFDIPAASPPARLRVIDNPGRIVSTGLNAAIRAARGHIIIRMDAHTEYAPDYVRRCVEVLEQTGADNVGGPWIANWDRYISRAIAAVFQSPFGVGGARSHNPEHEGEVDSVYLGCWRKSSFERFGYFDEELVRNQDDEHNLRIIRGGGKIWQSPKIKSWYRPRASLSALFKQYTQYGYWKVRVIQKHKLPASWRHLVPGAFVLMLVLLALCSLLLALLRAAIFHLPSSKSGPWSVVPWSSAALLALCSLLLAYASAVLAASLHTASKTGWKLLPILPMVFPCYHFGYGLGFLRGVWDFVIRRKGGQDTFGVLTR